MISVIICTYNRSQYIYNVLKSIAEGTLSPESYEIVVVNNNSTDLTKEEINRFVKDFPQINLRQCFERHLGLSYARNRGISEADGDILVYVDDDAVVNREYLETYNRFFESHPDVFAAGGPIIPKYEGCQEPEWMTYHLRRLLTAYLYFGDKEKVFPGENYPGGGNAAYRKVVFEKVGLYNPSLGRKGESLNGGEEKDIFRKMTNLDMKFYYLPGATLYHIITERRLNDDYFNRLTLSIGRSERMRTRTVSYGSYLLRLFSEGVKWAGTIFLWFCYAITGRLICANKLVKFRMNVTRGLLQS